MRGWQYFTKKAKSEPQKPASETQKEWGEGNVAGSKLANSQLSLLQLWTKVLGTLV